MDDNKNTINNADGQNNAGMNYSFDFANQVDTNAESNATSEVTTATPESSVTFNSASDVTASSPVEGVNSEVTNTDNVASVDNTLNMSAVSDSSASFEMPAVDNSENVDSPVAPETTNTVEQAAQTSDSIPVMPGVAPVTPETVSTEENNSEEENLELIKDKKETKRFLIILFVILLAFIIALPFIFSVAG